LYPQDAISGLIKSSMAAGCHLEKLQWHCAVSLQQHSFLVITDVMNMVIDVSYSCNKLDILLPWKQESVIRFDYFSETKLVSVLIRNRLR